MTAVKSPARRERSAGASVLLHATLLVATAVAVFPVVWILVSSFKPANRILASEIRFVDQPTLANYVKVLTETDFPHLVHELRGHRRLHDAVRRLHGRHRGLCAEQVQLPRPQVADVDLPHHTDVPGGHPDRPDYTIMANLGLINTLTSLVIAYCTVAVPFCTWMLKGYYDTIPRELDEAAALDGLGPFQTFWRVILPLARPGLAVTMFYTFLTGWSEIAYATAFLQTDDKFTLGYGLQTFVPQFNQRWEYLTPSAILVLIPAALVFLLAQRHLVSGLAAGATKG